MPTDNLSQIDLAKPLRRPADKLPFFVDGEGRESPLFVPPAMLDEARRLSPQLWIEATPIIPTHGSLTGSRPRFAVVDELEPSPTPEA